MGVQTHQQTAHIQRICLLLALHKPDLLLRASPRAKIISRSRLASDQYNYLDDHMELNTNLL